MNISATTKELLDAKRSKGLTFAQLGKVIGRDKVWVAALFYGQARADEEEAKKLVSTLELGEYIAEALTEFPSKGIGPVVPTDPLLYRLYEILQVYGMPMKAVIHEKFGDGILKGDRVKVTMSGKFLAYKKF